MSTQIYENEKLSLEKMIERCRKEEITGRYSYMHPSDNIKSNSRTHGNQNGTVVSRNITNKDGKNIIFVEGEESAEFTYIYGNGQGFGSADQVTVVYNKQNGQIAYHLHASEVHELLAYVDEKGEILFPLYSSEIVFDNPLPKHKEMGKLPISETGETVIETIGKVLESNPYLKSASPRILAAFEQILSLDEERKIIPATPEQIEVREKTIQVEELTKKNVELVRENNGNKGVIERLTGEKDALIKDNTKLTQENKVLTEEEIKLKAQNSELVAQNIRLTERLEQLMKMVERIPIFGKIIKRKIFEGMLPSGTEGRNEGQTGVSVGERDIREELKFTPQSINLEGNSKIANPRAKTIEEK